MIQQNAFRESLPSHIVPDVIDSMPLAMLCLASNYEAVYFNAHFSAFVEWDSATASRFTGMGALQALDIMPELQPSGLSSLGLLQEAVRMATLQGQYKGPWMLQSLNGTAVPANLTLLLRCDKDDTYILCYFTPVQSENKAIQEPSLSEEALAHLNHVAQPMTDKKYLYKTQSIHDLEHEIVDSLPFIMHIWSKDLELLDCSAEVCSVFGVADKEEFKQKYFTLCPEVQLGKNSQSLMQEHLRMAFEKGFCQFKWLHTDATGKILPCDVTLSRSTHSGEECVIGYTQDLSRLSSHVQEFAKVQESTRAMLDAAPMAITFWDSNYLLRDANSECARLFGFDDPEAFMKNFRNIIPRFQEDGTSSFAMVKNALRTAFEQGYHRSDFTLYHGKSKALIPLEIILVRLTVWNEEVVVAYIRDLRDIKALIKKMQTTEERIQTIFDITPLGINVWDKNYNLIECNDAIVQLYGFANKEEYLATRYRAMPRLQADGTPTIPYVRESLEKAFENGEAKLDLLTQDLQGNPIPVEVVSKKAFVQQQEVVISYVRDMREVKAKMAEIHAAQQELRTARDIAEQSAQAKTEFLGNVSHEIRTPLNGVLGLLHVLDATSLNSAQKDYVGKSITSANKLMGLVDNVLDFSKIDAGTFEMESAAFTLKDISDELKLVYGPSMADKKLSFTVNTDETLEDTLYGDAARLKQVLFNLLSNALKYTEQGHVTVRMNFTEQQGEERQYVFSVEDSGIGMTKAQSVHVFSAFAQADSSITRKYEGAGLGLAIAKRISKLMQGDMWVETVEGEGSTFYFSATFKADAAPKFEVRDILSQEGDALALSQQALQGGSILLAEDNEINQIIAVELLKNKNYTVDVAVNGKEAVRMVQEKPYDMVLMDIQMPIMDGLTATTKIRSLEGYADLPIVAMSAHAMSGDKELSLQHGMNDHLCKPIIPSVLYESVGKWCKKPE